MNLSVDNVITIQELVSVLSLEDCGAFTEISHVCQRYPQIGSDS